jgi:DNA-binding MarR family transcriptional regulator
VSGDPGLRYRQLRKLLRAVERTAAQHTLFTQAVALQLGIATTDLECLRFLQEVGFATAGRLADDLNLTTGAVTGVIDRLESTGFVFRETDPADRRRVIVRPVVERLEAVDSAYDSVLAGLSPSLRGFSELDLDKAIEFEQRINDEFRQESLRLKSAAAGGPNPRYTAPLGGLRAACLEFATGAAGLRIRAFEDDPNALYEASFEGAQPTARLQDGSLSFRYKRMSPFEWGGKHSGLVALSTRIPWNIDLRGGASRVVLEGADLQLASLSVHGGASAIDLSLPSPRGTVRACFEGGVSRAQIQHPAGVPVELQVRGGANRLEFGPQRFGAIGGDLRLASPDWDLATDRYVISVGGGASRLTVKEVA